MCVHKTCRETSRSGTEQPQDMGGVFESQLKPQFKMKPNDSEVREGHTVRFDTLVTGRPLPELTWLLDEQKVHPDDNHKVNSVRRQFILNASEMHNR